ncbi:hypothetical protein D3C81_264240 [compost metagenome]
MSSQKTALCRYRYDALDQLVGREPAGQEKTQRFYCHEHLATKLDGQASQSVFQSGKQLLAEQRREGDDLESRLLATDQQRSVLQLTHQGRPVWQAFTPYGHRRVESGRGSLPAFNGEVMDSVTGHYLLGNGHRAFNPVLMRFNSPDSLSPFGRGGLNPYAYCLGDPVNFSDPTGRWAAAAIARILTSIGALFNSVITLRPGIPFQVGLDALENGAAFRLPMRHTVGAASAVLAGVAGVAGAVVGVGSTIITAINPTSTLLAPMANTALGLMSGSVASRFGSWWAARNPEVIPALKNLVGGSSSPARPSAWPNARERFETAIVMGSYSPTAPLPSPVTPQPSAPLQTPVGIGFEAFSYEVRNPIRRRNSR